MHTGRCSAWWQGLEKTVLENGIKVELWGIKEVEGGGWGSGVEQKQEEEEEGVRIIDHPPPLSRISISVLT